MSRTAPASRKATPRPDRAAAERRRKSALLAASAAGHLGAFLLIFGAAAGDVISDAGQAAADSEGMQVSLVDASSLAPAGASAAPSQAAPLLDLRARLADHGTVAPVSDHAGSQGFSSLVNRLQQTTIATSGAANARRTPTPLQPEPASPASGPTGHESPVRGQASTGDLWSRIEPCWRDIGGRLNRPVTLQLSLNRDSKLDRPPVVLRPSDARLDEAQLGAEAAALQALQQCLPRGDPRFAGRVYRVEFRSAK